MDTTFGRRARRDAPPPVGGQLRLRDLERLRPVHADGGIETLAGTWRGVPVMLVRTADEEVADRQREVLDLLGELEAAGITAVPRVLCGDGKEHVREAGRPLHGGAGKRRAACPNPGTAERLGQAAARDQLDRALSALHDRGWVLGLSGESGVGIREDGLVVIEDLRGLRRSDRMADRIADQHGLEELLGDGGRTLRRRVDAEPRKGEVSYAFPVLGGQARPAAGAVSPAPATSVPLPVAPQQASATTPPAPVTPHASRRRPASGRRDGPRRSTPNRARGRRGPLRRWLPAWGPREIWTAVSIGGLGAVVVALALLGTLGSRGGPEPAEARPSVAEDSSPVPATSGPSLENPAATLQELADRRRDYVSGRPETTTVAAPQSEAEQTDDALRSQYAEGRVSGFRTVVHEARVLSHGADGESATVQAQIEESASTLVAADGTRREVPASGRREVLVDLVVIDGAWRVSRTRPADG